MLVNWKEHIHSYEIKVSYKEIFRKGTVALITTFGAGLLFGKQNMMIAFVLVLGSNILARQNLRIKTMHKTLRLILIDILIVCIAFIASLNRWVALGINLLAIFCIIYFTVSPYEQGLYKTFMMLFVFCQYTKVTLGQFPQRLWMVVFSVIIIVGANYMEQKRKKSLLEPQVKRTFELIYKQLEQLEKGMYSTKIQRQITKQMNELAYVIYRTSYGRYFTTYLGKVHFHFYLNLSYFNVLLESIYKARHNQFQSSLITTEEITKVKYIIEGINVYFERGMTREELIRLLDQYEDQEEDHELQMEVAQLIEALKRNFKELQDLSYKSKHKVYDEWKKSDLNKMRVKMREGLNPNSMSFNFAVRLAVLLSLALLLASFVGFYKFIWAIIPIMSITQPYYEDTSHRKFDRVTSNVLAAIIVTVIVNVVQTNWTSYILIIASFYMLYAYSDYYHFSLFLTVVSMCIASFDMGINTLLFYRVIYVVIGATIVELSSRVYPYRIKNGIEELTTQIDSLNDMLERESVLSLEGAGNLNRIREGVICTALLNEKMQLRNDVYKSEHVEAMIRENVEFAIRLGHKILRDRNIKEEQGTAKT